MSDAVLSPDPVVVDVPSDAPVPVADEAQSLADHEAAFTRAPNGQRPSAREDGIDGETQAERDERGRFRHRAQGDMAKADDVPTINALTKELRDKEAELIKLKPESGSDSPRVRRLRLQIKGLEAELGTNMPAPVKTTTPRQAAGPLSAAPVTRTKPTEDEIGTKYATYGDYVEDLTDWKAEQRDAKRVEADQSAAQAEAQRQVYSDFAAREAAFEKTRPDYRSVVQSAPHQSEELTPLLLATLLTSDNGPELRYYLAQHPGDFFQMLLDTDGKAVTSRSVEITQRALASRVSAATTGSATVARPPFISPKPPNPVRTGPIRTGDDLPGDESSLAAHEAAFNSRRRR